jgi:hypothetical protein
LQEAIEYSGNKWSEWGERAEHVGELLDEALATLRKHDEAEAVGEVGEADWFKELFLAFRKGKTLIIGNFRDDYKIPQSAFFVEVEAARSVVRALLAARPTPTDEKALKVIRDTADQLDRWANESRSGGWSTHQVDPMRRKADELRRFAALAREAPKDKHPVTYPKKHVTDGSRKGLVIHAPKDESKMIRYILIGDQINEGESQFAFFDTMIDNFLAFEGEQVFDDIEDFKCCARDNPRLERCLALIPKDESKEGGS